MSTIARFLKMPQKVTIDACQVFGPDTVFLQQAAHLTGGAYLYMERRDALLQYLIVSLSISNSTFNPHLSFFKMTFLPPSSIRKVLAIPTQDKIDFRAACFCHKNIIDIGFVCSVCLSSTLAITSSRILYLAHTTSTSSSILSAGTSVLYLPVCTPFLSSSPRFFLTCYLAEQNSPLKHCSVLMLLALCCRQPLILRDPRQSARQWSGSNLPLEKIQRWERSPPPRTALNIDFFSSHV